MIEIEYKEELTEDELILLDDEFNKYAEKKGITCGYTPFNYVAKEEGKIVGLIRGHAYYKEVCIDDLIVLEEYRENNIGSELVKKVEEQYKNKGYDILTVTTHEFQAPGFYKKCGFELEFIRENKNNPKHTKYFFMKEF